MKMVFLQVHGDVFRPASNPLIFSALIGTGYQIATVVLIVICFAIFGDLYAEYVFIHIALMPHLNRG